MSAQAGAVERYADVLREEYARRFPRSLQHTRRSEARLLDATSHAVRWNEPFMPVMRSARGAEVEDLDGNRFVDYWQGHMTNLLGHNPESVCRALAAALKAGEGLQSGMLHESEARVAETVCRMTATECVRFTTSGSLGTFYAVLLARAFTGRDRVLKISGGWHGSQPFGLKGVSPRDASFDHLESEGLSASTGTEIVLTRFNDLDDLRARFASGGERIACLMLEPLMSAAGGLCATREYLAEARRLTEAHGALLLCDEIITGFRFRPGDLSAAYGVRPDILILGKVLGGGMPVAAVAGRRDVLELGTRAVGRVKFEGGTFSAHPLSMIAAATLLEHVESKAAEVYPALERRGTALRHGIAAAAQAEGIPVHVLGGVHSGLPGSSLVYVHATREPGPLPACPEDLAASAHPLISDRLLKATLLLEGVSTRAGGGAVSTAHGDEHVERTLDGYRAGLARLRAAGLCATPA